MLTPAQARALDGLRRRCDSAGQLQCFNELVQQPKMRAWLAGLAASPVPGTRKDADNLPYAARQLEHIFTEVVEKRYPARVFADQTDPLIAWDESVDRGAKTFTYYLSDRTTSAVFIATLGSDPLPRPALLGAEVTGRVQPFANEWAWTMFEMWSAAFAGDNLEPRRAAAALEGHIDLLDKTAAYGREDLQVRGFINNENINVVASPNGVSGFPGWDTKTGPEIAADVLSLVRGIENDSRQIYQPNIVALPKQYLNLINDTLMNSDGNNNGGSNLQTVREYLDKVLNQEGRTIRYRAVENLLAENSFTNLPNDAMMAFNDDPEFVSLIVPLWAERMPMRETTFGFEIALASMIGGIKLPHPLSVARMDGLDIVA